MKSVQSRGISKIWLQHRKPGEESDREQRMKYLVGHDKGDFFFVVFFIDIIFLNFSFIFESSFVNNIREFHCINSI
jgi:hypothetical protein